MHAHSSVHGDLKLDNALVDGDGTIKLSDFDLSRDSDEETKTFTSSVHVMMTTRAAKG